MDFQNRQYDPQIGRFLSVAPLADDDQEEWSPYAAMGNNPAMMVDPLGLKGDSPQSIGGNATVKEYPGTEYKGYLFFVSKNAPLKSVDGAALANYLITGNSKALLGERIQQGSGETAGNDLNQEGKSDGNGMKAEPGEKLGEGAFDHTADMPEANKLATAKAEDKKTEPKNKDSYEWKDFAGDASRFNWWLSLATTGLQKTPGSFRLTNGAYNGSALSPKYYASAWRGGSRARITTYNISKIGTTASRGLVVIAITADYVSYRRGEISGGKFSFNTGMGVWGLTGAGTIPAILYFGVDATYPGGWLARLC